MLFEGCVMLKIILFVLNRFLGVEIRWWSFNGGILGVVFLDVCSWGLLSCFEEGGVFVKRVWVGMLEECFKGSLSSYRDTCVFISSYLLFVWGEN